jgi:hypothetical protein
MGLHFCLHCVQRTKTPEDWTLHQFRSRIYIALTRFSQKAPIVMAWLPILITVLQFQVDFRGELPPHPGGTPA